MVFWENARAEKSEVKLQISKYDPKNLKLTLFCVLAYPSLHLKFQVEYSIYRPVEDVPPPKMTIEATKSSYTTFHVFVYDRKCILHFSNVFLSEISCE